MKREYVLITPVHNEEDLVEQVIKSVISQTVLPKKWLIVDDGSTDATGEIINKYKAKYDFIDYRHLHRSDIKTYYSRRINVILAGIEYIHNMEYDYIAFLDADLTIETTYYENILSEFDRNPKLGIASGIYENYINGKLYKVIRDKENISTPGGLQVFRRECYEAIGGHVPLPYGGSDALMGILARMKGWQTRCFPEYKTIHYRPIGVRFGKGALRVKFKQGMQEFDLGTHLLFMAAKSVRRFVVEKPYFLGGLLRLLGFLYLCLRRRKRIIADEALRYVQQEQLDRLYSSVRNVFHLHTPATIDDHIFETCSFPCLIEKKYVIVTAAYNEEAFIGPLIECVVSQTILPEKWIIVDNGSTDKTEQIIKQYASQHDFIEYYRLDRPNNKSYYCHKITAFTAGVEKVRHIKFDFIASLDADMTLKPTYYKNVLREFEYNPKLGIASGIYINNINGKLQRVKRDNTSTPGALQMFRRDCFERIGGYMLLHWGGEDALADVMAQMKGWQTRSFSQYKTMHHRPLGVRGSINTLKAKVVQGRAEYDLGSHPIFVSAKCIRRAFVEKPYLVSGVLRLYGFFQSVISNKERTAPKEAIAFIRKKQMKRLLSFRLNRE